MRVTIGRNARVAGVAVLGIFATVLAVGVAQADQTRSSRAAATVTPTVAGVSSSGNGCPSSGTKPKVTIAGAAVSATFTKYAAKAGGSSSITEARKNCALLLKVTVPAGYTYTVSKAVFTGSTKVASGASTQQQASYFFSANAAATTTLTHRFTASKSFTNTDTSAKLASLGQAPCSGPGSVSINSSLRASKGSDVAKVSTVNLTSAAITLKAVKC